MSHERPLPTVIGATENALRAVLTAILAQTPIQSYAAWVTLSTLASRGPDNRSDPGRPAVGHALKATAADVEHVLGQLCAAGLTNPQDALTARGEVELAAARTLVAAATGRLVDGVGHDELAITRRVLDHVRLRAEDMLKPDVPDATSGPRSQA